MTLEKRLGLGKKLEKALLIELEIKPNGVSFICKQKQLNSQSRN